MVDIQSAAAEIRRGKKKEERKRTNHSMKIYMVSLLHRATIKKTNLWFRGFVEEWGAKFGLSH